MINTFPGQICWFIWLRPVGVHVLDGCQAHVLHVQVDLTHGRLVLLLADTYLNKNRIVSLRYALDFRNRLISDYGSEPAILKNHVLH